MKPSLFNALIPSFSNVFIWLNAILMLVGIFVLGWEPEVVIIAYFLETIIIGVIHVFKLLVVLRFGAQQGIDPTKKDVFSGFSVIPFFILHYFFFIFVQSIFIFEMLEDMIPSENGSFNVFSNYAYLLSQHDVFMAFLTLAFSNVAMTFKNFILPGEFRRTTTSKLYFQPYVRIFIQQFVTIFAWFFMFLSSSAMAAALLIIIFRLIVDLFLNKASMDKTFKAQLMTRLKKNQKFEDAEQTEKSFDSFLEK
ncbi:hypothetical protein EZ428_16345 [Pedobacter frigiditerrae]|uniref:Uncharacterized protein n=1 Tax=Pedobacter frigiditerrae TaxID=2530452 RepID=A0A4V2MI73_9SPHI|nr:DUF6498-containing protein [Pedobacter frigiditerrae]TCC89266.1 hypothetical protein EZ428_16345 [Pedobacter frigiditerrae]